MRHTLWIALGLFTSLCQAGSPCGAVAPSSTDGARYVLAQSTTTVALYRCVTQCNELVGSEAITDFYSAVVDGIQAEKSALETIAGCVEKRAIDEDNILSRPETLTPAEKKAVLASNEITKSEVQAMRKRLNAMRDLTQTLRAKMRDSQIELGLESEPLLRRLARARFGRR